MPGTECTREFRERISFGRYNSRQAVSHKLDGSEISSTPHVAHANLEMLRETNHAVERFSFVRDMTKTFTLMKSKTPFLNFAASERRWRKLRTVIQKVDYGNKKVREWIGLRKNLDNHAIV